MWTDWWITCMSNTAVISFVLNYDLFGSNCINRATNHRKIVVQRKQNGFPFYLVLGKPLIGFITTFRFHWRFTLVCNDSVLQIWQSASVIMITWIESRGSFILWFQDHTVYQFLLRQCCTQLTQLFPTTFISLGLKTRNISLPSFSITIKNASWLNSPS